MSLLVPEIKNNKTPDNYNKYYLNQLFRYMISLDDNEKKAFEIVK